MLLLRNFDLQVIFLRKRPCSGLTQVLTARWAKPGVVKLILFISITLHLLAPPCLRYEYMSFDRSFCCRSTNSMYRPSGSQYFLVRICVCCHPHLPSSVRLSLGRKNGGHTAIESFFHLVGWAYFLFYYYSRRGDYLVDSLHWKYDDFPGPIRLTPALF